MNWIFDGSPSVADAMRYVIELANAPCGASVPVPEYFTTEQVRNCLLLADAHRVWLREPGYVLQADGIYAV